jgi:hypothetical protein
VESRSHDLAIRSKEVPAESCVFLTDWFLKNKPMRFSVVFGKCVFNFESCIGQKLTYTRQMADPRREIGASWHDNKFPSGTTTQISYTLTKTRQLIKFDLTGSISNEFLGANA